MQMGKSRNMRDARNTFAFHRSPRFLEFTQLLPEIFCLFCVLCCQTLYNQHHGWVCWALDARDKVAALNIALNFSQTFPEGFLANGSFSRENRIRTSWSFYLGLLLNWKLEERNRSQYSTKRVLFL